jgi:hypothetical protein
MLASDERAALRALIDQRQRDKLRLPPRIEQKKPVEVIADLTLQVLPDSEWRQCSEIAQQIGVPARRVGTALRWLRQQGEVEQRTNCTTARWRRTAARI